MSAPRTSRATGRRATRNFYRAVLSDAEQAILAAAGGEGLDDEVALLRLMIRRELDADPVDLRMVNQQLTLLIRAAVARQRLSTDDQQQFYDRLATTMRDTLGIDGPDAGDQPAGG